MTTETFEFQGVSGTTHYVAIFRVADGHVFDWDDGTFKAFGSATEKTVEVTDELAIGGSGQSLFSLDVDLATLNNTSMPGQFLLSWFTDNVATVLVSQALLITVTSGAIAAEEAEAIAELTGDPGATPTLSEAVMLLYMEARNKLEIHKSPALKKIHNNAGAVILQQTLDDNGDRFQKGQVASP